MRTHTALPVLAAGGLLALTLPAAAQAVDTSAWTCSACPYPKGAAGQITAGAGRVSDDAPRFGNRNGLPGERGVFPVLDGELRWDADGRGLHLGAAATSAGGGALALQAALDGVFNARLGLSESTWWGPDDARTPFTGVGGERLALPAGFAPAASTRAMPLATALQPVDLDLTRRRLDAAVQLLALDPLRLQLTVGRDRREGTRAMWGSFFATAAQLPAPVDETTDRVELSASLRWAGIDATLGWRMSRFDGGPAALTWDNPFLPVVRGAVTGQLALAPANRLQQVFGSAGTTFGRATRVSGEFAIGRLTQDEPFVPVTANAVLLPSIAALPAASLDGRVDTFHGSLRVTSALTPTLSANASYIRDVRNNRTALRTWPQVATDVFADDAPRGNVAFDLTQDRLKLGADWRGPGSLKVSAGADVDRRVRPYTEVVTTRETTLWARAGLQVAEPLALSVKAQHARRDHSTYGTATWFGSPDNPLLRKYNLAERRRNALGLRADVAAGENVTVGLSAEAFDDDYARSLVGLQSSRGLTVAADAAWQWTPRTRLSAYAASDATRARQAGTQDGLAPDWAARSDDRVRTAGVAVRHQLVADKLELGLDIARTRATADVAMAVPYAAPALPAINARTNTVRLSADWRVSDAMSLNAWLWHERHRSQDWALDGVLPASVINLLTLGTASPHHGVDAFALALRWRF